MAEKRPTGTDPLTRGNVHELKDSDLSVGNSYHTSLTRQSPKEMTDEVLSNIFGPTTAPIKVEPVKDEFKPGGSNFGR